MKTYQKQRKQGTIETIGNPKEKANAIRQLLKKHGYSNKQISVRTDYSSLDSAIDITIKDMSINQEYIEKLVSGFERVDRCNITNEILSGGNTFVMVQYDYSVLNELAKLYMDRAKEIKSIKLDSSTNTGILETGKVFARYYPSEQEIKIFTKPENERIRSYGAMDIFQIANAICLINAQYT